MRILSIFKPCADIAQELDRGELRGGGADERSQIAGDKAFLNRGKAGGFELRGKEIGRAHV